MIKPIIDWSHSSLRFIQSKKFPTLAFCCVWIFCVAWTHSVSLSNSLCFSLLNWVFLRKMIAFLCFCLIFKMGLFVFAMFNVVFFKVCCFVLWFDLWVGFVFDVYLPDAGRHVFLVNLVLYISKKYLLNINTLLQFMIMIWLLFHLDLISHLHCIPLAGGDFNSFSLMCPPQETKTLLCLQCK